MALDIREWSGKVNHAELPVNQPPPAVAFTSFADVWPRATETDIGAALCTIGTGRTLNLTFMRCLISHINLNTYINILPEPTLMEANFTAFDM